MTSSVHGVALSTFPLFEVTDNRDVVEPFCATYENIDLLNRNTAGDGLPHFKGHLLEGDSLNFGRPLQNQNQNENESRPLPSASARPGLTLQTELSYDSRTLSQPPLQAMEPTSIISPVTAATLPQPSTMEQLIQQRPSTPINDISITTTAMCLQTPLPFTSALPPSYSSPLSEPPSPSDEVELVHFPSSPILSNSPITQSSPLSSSFSEHDIHIAGLPIDYEYEGPPGHRLLRFKPTPAQWTEFPAILNLARRLGAEGDGCFKIVLPTELQDPLPDKPRQRVPANAYRARQIRQRMFWQVSTVGAEGVFSSSEEEADCSGSAESAVKHLKTLFNKNKDRQMKNVRYRVDVPAWTAKQRQEAGVPRRSPIHPLKGDQLDNTKAIIPGIHTPYVYESAPFFGATFQLHAEDFRLYSLNHLYKGRKIWIVIPTTAVDIAEKALNRKNKCSQFMRHRAEFFFPDRLEKMGIPYRIVDQRPAETIVILPDAYHEGFSTGYTLAEAKNYADPEWTVETYQPCQVSCKLATAIPGEFMRPLHGDEARIDLCAGYDDDENVPLQHSKEPTPPHSASKRGYEDEPEALEERESKQVKTH